MKPIPRFLSIFTFTTPKQFLIFFLSLCLFFSSFVHAKATEEFDPSEIYYVQSVPESPSKLQLINSKDYVNSESGLKTHGQIISEAQVKGSPSETIQQLFDSTQQTLNSLTETSKDSMRKAGHLFLEWLKKDGVRTYYNTGWVMLAAILSFHYPMNPETFNAFHSFYKSGIDLEVRLIVAYTSYITSYVQETSWSDTYSTQLNNFQINANWQVGAVESDIVLVAGAILLAGLLLAGGAVASVAKSIIAPLIGFLPSSKKIGTYFLKETKDAFIETEKECNERKDECKSVFDKGTILLFNYLPDKMPDLGMDDVIINLKNSFSNSTTAQK